MSVKPIYEFEYLTTSTDAVPTDLVGSTYWYDTGETENGQAVCYDTSDTYAFWFSGTQWVVTLIVFVGGTPFDYFSAETGATISDLTGFGTFEGTLTISADTISDAWYRAETAAFESLADFVGAIEGRECFRGFLPVQGDSDDDKYTNVWQMTSGDSTQFEMDRLYGENANWCSLRSDARIESLWEDREKAMRFAGTVLAWLKSTNNLKETGNVTWCTLSEIPMEPEIYRTDGKKNRERLWRQTINLELVYSTGSSY